MARNPEVQAAIARVRWKRARGLPDPKPKRPGPRVVDQLSLAREEKLLDALNRAREVMAEAVRLADLARQSPNPPRDGVLAAAEKASKLILTGLHEAGLDPPRLNRKEERN
jgi:hypothetical protein